MACSNCGILYVSAYFNASAYNSDIAKLSEVWLYNFWCENHFSMLCKSSWKTSCVSSTMQIACLTANWTKNETKISVLRKFSQFEEKSIPLPFISFTLFVTTYQQNNSKAFFTGVALGKYLCQSTVTYSCKWLRWTRGNVFKTWWNTGCLVINR